MIDRSIPLVDLHRHLDGSVRLQTILDLGQRHNLPLPAWDLEGLRPHVQVIGSQAEGASLPGVMAFIAKFEWMTRVLVDADACRRIAYENVEDARREGIHYIELRFSPWFMAQAHGLTLASVVEAVIEGAQAGALEFGVQVKLIGILSRTYGVEAAWKELEALTPFRDHLAALDLAGDEANWPGELFVNHMARARDLGWQITVHAGESAGPESIWQALRELEAARIGHGVAAIQDPALLDYMAEHQIGVESCLTSNVQTRTVPNYRSHPLREFLQRGLRASINTDDPGISAIDLPYEYEVAAPAAGLTAAQIHQAQQNAFETSFMSSDERKALLKTITEQDSPI